MAFSTLTDIVGSNAFGAYVNKAIADNSDIIKSGAVDNSGDFASAIARNGGKTSSVVTVPSIADISGDAQDIVDGSAATVNTLTAAREILPAVAKIKSFGFYDSTTDLSSADPAGAIAASVGKYWARQSKRYLAKALEGVFGVSALSGKVLDASSSVLDLDVFAAACNLAGDQQDNLAVAWCHSAVASKLRQIGKSAYVSHPADGSALLDEFQGKKIVADDYLAGTSGVYPVYLLAKGALVLNPLFCANEYEAEREAAYSRTSVIVRKRFVVGPRGVAFTVPAGRTSGANGASDTELATAANWSAVVQPADFGIVKLLVRVAAAPAADTPASPDTPDTPDPDPKD